MKKLLLTYLLLLLISSCGKPKEAEIIGGAVSVEDFESYTDEFKARMAIAGIAMPAPELFFEVRKDMPSNIIGSCSSRLNTTTLLTEKLVKINYYYWLRLTVPAREELIFHELGHCLLNRPHLDTLDGDGKPISIMNSFHMGPTVYVPKYTSLIQELFQVSNPLFAGIVFDGSLYASTESASHLVMPIAAEGNHFECGWTENH